MAFIRGLSCPGALQSLLASMQYQSVLVLCGRGIEKVSVENRTFVSPASEVHMQNRFSKSQLC